MGGRTATANPGSSLSKVFAFNRAGLHWSLALLGLALALVLAAVLWAADGEQYLLSAVFGVVFAAAADPGGAYGYRASHQVAFALGGAVLTAIGFAVGTAASGWVVLAAFAVTFVAGLAVKYGVHRFVAAELLNIWFIVALAIADSYQRSHAASHVWGQAVAWLAGAVLWIAITFVAWLTLRGREERPQPIAELPGDISRRQLTRPLIMFAAIRAVAVAITVAIPFGLGLPHADWMPVAAIVAMKPRLDEAKLASEQRLIGALIGAALAALFLVTVSNKHGLELITIVFLTLGGAIRFANYALYTAAIAAGVLIALDLPHPTNFSAEAQRVLFTFVGLAVGLLVMLLATQLAKRGAKPQAPATTQPA